MSWYQNRARNFKLTCLYLFFVFVLFYIFGSLYWIISLNHLSDVAFLETEKCPACFGESLCPKLLNNEIEFTGISKFRSFDALNTKNIYFARQKDTGALLVVKKLARDTEFVEIDMKICHDAGMDNHCDLQTAILRLPIIQTGAKLDQVAKHLQGLTPLFVCPSVRLIQRAIDKYKEKTLAEQIVNRDKVQLWTSSLVNAEPIILQAFPAEDGWPFPKYHGACGRYVVVDYSGRPVSEFYNAPWTKRVDIAYQILKIAEHLTHNKDEFSLYLTDVSAGNFVVDPSGKVTVVDAEDIVVVDIRAVKVAKPPGWEDIHESPNADCLGKPFKQCHPFSETQLCSHVTSDHNYYAVCRFLLSRYAQMSDTGFQDGGLLYDIPDVAKDEWDLEYLLSECAMPQRQRGRVQVVHKLIEALDNLRQNISRNAV